MRLRGLRVRRPQLKPDDYINDYHFYVGDDYHYDYNCDDESDDVGYGGYVYAHYASQT